MNSIPDQYDVAVIGAGIAGASLASELVLSKRVILIERETQPGYHTTGRSAALFSAIYGPAAIRALSRASLPFFRAPPPSFAAGGLISPRGVLMVARNDQQSELMALLRQVSGRGSVQLIGRKQTRQMMPLLREDYAAAAVFEEDASDIDVHALHHGYLRSFRDAGGRTEVDSEITALERLKSAWRITTSKGTWDASIVVNASGAWADEIGLLAGAVPARLTPKRRTAAIVRAPGKADPRWPMVVDVAEKFYLKPESGKLLISPADETPSPPCDAQPDELDIAICVDRIEAAFDLQVRLIESKWAGLRTFAPDKQPVVGFDAEVPDFFWLAGQGGYGIQTAPAMARLAASLIIGKGVPADIEDEGLDASELAPSRLARAA